MGYKLFKKSTTGSYSETSFDDLDNKAFWCDHGEKQETAFVGVMSKVMTRYAVEVHPRKREDPFHPDLLVTVTSTGDSHIGEVKIKNSPLFFGDRYGVSPQFALTMDLKDSFNYSKWLLRNVDLTIFIWVKWEAHRMETERRTYEVSPMSGIWVTKFSKLRNLEQVNPPPIHWYNSPFRQSPIYQFDQEKEWCDELIAFDRRLLRRENRVKNITSRGYIRSDSGETFPAGHSAGSYVFNLRDDAVFDELFLRMN